MPPQQKLALTAGLAVAFAYLLGSVPFGYLLTRRRLRLGLRRVGDGSASLEEQLRSLLAGGDSSRRDELLAAVLDTAKVLVAATVAWRAVKIVAPPFDRGLLDPSSAVGFLSDQVITVWQSAALWAGMAAVVGHLQPLWLRVRGGQAPALGLVLVYCPLGFAVGTAAFFLAYAVTRRVGVAVLASLPGLMGYAWLAWVFDWDPSYGATNGPELALWCAVLSGVVGVRTLAATGAPAQ